MTRSTRGSVRVTVPALLIALAGCASPTPPAGYPEAMLASGFAGSPPELAARVVQDEAQRVCSTTDVAVLRARAPDLAAQARATMRYPSTGRLVGDWRVGEKLALSGVGGRIRNRQVEKGDASGGNCYACHTMSPAEPNAGTLGPSLVGWGRRRGSDALAARYAYESIYNRWAFQPCSAMPRLGASGLLSVEQVAHLVAYLLDPDSPVNR